MLITLSIENLSIHDCCDHEGNNLISIDKADAELGK